MLPDLRGDSSSLSVSSNLLGLPQRRAGRAVPPGVCILTICVSQYLHEQEGIQ